MTTDDIIRMAREADLWGEIYAMQRFANLVAAAEREACASLEVEVVVPPRDYHPMTPLDCYEAALMDQAIAFRAAIRARGQIKPKPETVSPAELRRRTNAPWNDKASY
jgi:hypothetical protein